LGRMLLLATSLQCCRPKCSVNTYLSQPVHAYCICTAMAHTDTVCNCIPHFHGDTGTRLKSRLAFHISIEHMATRAWHETTNKATPLHIDDDRFPVAGEAQNAARLPRLLFTTAMTRRHGR
jgi:hypothetical protein